MLPPDGLVGTEPCRASFTLLAGHDASTTAPNPDDAAHPATASAGYESDPHAGNAMRLLSCRAAAKIVSSAPGSATSCTARGRFSAESATGTDEISEASILHSMLELGKEARRVLQGTMDAFARRDAKAARYIWEEDDVVDVRYHLVRHDLMTMLEGGRAIPALQSDSRSLQRATYLLWIAHKLERVGDHCSNICERIVFIVEGEMSIKPAHDEV